MIISSPYVIWFYIIRHRAVSPEQPVCKGQADRLIIFCNLVMFIFSSKSALLHMNLVK